MRSFVVRRMPQAWLVLFLAGAGLIALGILIVLVPQLLRAMLAAVFITCGAALASVGWRLRHGPPRAGPPWQSRWFEP